MDSIEAKLTPGVIMIVDDDATSAVRVERSLREWFAPSSITIRTWREQLAERGEMSWDLVILSPAVLRPGTPDPIPAVLAQLSRVPTIVLTDPCEPQRAVNAVLDGASDAMVMDPSALELLPARIRRMLARGRFQKPRDRRGTAITESLRRSRQQNRRLRDELGHVQTAALLDPLTGLGNRRMLDQRLVRLWETAVASDSDLSCLVIDLDNFKAVNDSLGHAAGDRLLVLTARVLLDQCRQDDVAARTGGDEFVVVLHAASAEQAQQVAQRLRAEFEKETRRLLAETSGPALCVVEREAVNERVALHGGRPHGLATISVGVSSRRLNRPSTAQDLIAQADEAMYVAKRSGKNRVELRVPGGAAGVRWAAAG